MPAEGAHDASPVPAPALAGVTPHTRRPRTAPRVQCAPAPAEVRARRPPSTLVAAARESRPRTTGSAPCGEEPRAPVVSGAPLRPGPGTRTSPRHGKQQRKRRHHGPRLVPACPVHRHRVEAGRPAGTGRGRSDRPGHGGGGPHLPQRAERLPGPTRRLGPAGGPGPDGAAGRRPDRRRHQRPGLRDRADPPATRRGAAHPGPRRRRPDTAGAGQGSRRPHPHRRDPHVRPAPGGRPPRQPPRDQEGAGRLHAAGAA